MDCAIGSRPKLMWKITERKNFLQTLQDQADYFHQQASDKYRNLQKLAKELCVEPGIEDLHWPSPPPDPSGRTVDVTKAELRTS